MQWFERFKGKELSYYLELSKSYNGYEREKALIYLAGISDPIVFPVLLLRLNDYVPQVRARAEQAMTNWLMDASQVDLCIQYFSEIAALEKRKRVSDMVIQAFAGYLAQQKPLIKQILLKDQGKRPRALFEWAQKYEWFSPVELQDITRNSVDQALRRQWLAVLQLQKDDIELLEAELASRFKDVQKKVYLLIAAHHPYERWQTLFVSALQSAATAKGLRQLIIFYLKRQHFDFISFINGLPASSDEKAALLVMDIAQELKQDLAPSVAQRLLKSPVINCQFVAIDYLIQFGYEDIVPAKLLDLVLRYDQLKMTELYQSLKYLKQLDRLSLQLINQVISERELPIEDAYLIAQLLYSWDRFIVSLQLTLQLAKENGQYWMVSAQLYDRLWGLPQKTYLSAEQKRLIKNVFLELLGYLELKTYEKNSVEVAKQLIVLGVITKQDLPPVFAVFL